MNSLCTNFAIVGAFVAGRRSTANEMFTALDYDLSDIALDSIERICDKRLYQANFKAWKRAADARNGNTP